MKKTLSILSTCAAVLLVVFLLSSTAVPVKAQILEEMGACISYGGTWDYSAWTCRFYNNDWAIPGSGGVGWPAQCNSTGYAWYYFLQSQVGYLSPDDFNSEFGCYPY